MRADDGLRHLAQRWRGAMWTVFETRRRTWLVGVLGRAGGRVPFFCLIREEFCGRVSIGALGAVWMRK